MLSSRHVLKSFNLLAVVGTRLKVNFSHQRNISKHFLVGKSSKFQSRNMSYSTIEKGSPNTLDYRIYFSDEHGPISPFHDIPLFADATKKVFNMVVEIPRWTNAKMEVSAVQTVNTAVIIVGCQGPDLGIPPGFNLMADIINTSEALNPIQQDVKKEKLRFVHNCFPHHGYIWNYGAFPQTWENPQCLDEGTGCKGDNDPIDVLEIGYRVAKKGDVVQVKVLGIMGLIDEGETDWKVIAIDTKDPMAAKVNDIKDVEEQFPGLIRATHEWFKIYKIPDGKPPNQFAFNGEAKNKEFAFHVIEETHKYWENLVNVKSDDCTLSRTSVTISNSPYVVSRETATDIVKGAAEPGPAAKIDPIVDKWHFVQLE